MFSYDFKSPNKDWVPENKDLLVKKRARNFLVFILYLISFGIFLILAASRFIPHPPNFTSLIALSFYVPAIMGRKFIIPLIFSFFITDLFVFPLCAS